MEHRRKVVPDNYALQAALTHDQSKCNCRWLARTALASLLVIYSQTIKTVTMDFYFLFFKVWRLLGAAVQ